jgi:hypothetical protein
MREPDTYPNLNAKGENKFLDFATAPEKLFSFNCAPESIFATFDLPKVLI